MTVAGRPAPPSDVVIARARVADADAISALVHALSHHFLALDDAEEVGAFRDATSPARIARHLEDPARLYLVARHPSRLAGFIAIKDGTRVSQFFVEPAFQGRGIGRRLWEAALAGSSAGADAEFTVDASRQAVGVYERFGFAPCGPVTRVRGIVHVPMRRPAPRDPHSQPPDPPCPTRPAR